jgi:hypothetical protein
MKKLELLQNVGTTNTSQDSIFEVGPDNVTGNFFYDIRVAMKDLQDKIADLRRTAEETKIDQAVLQQENQRLRGVLEDIRTYCVHDGKECSELCDCSSEMSVMAAMALKRKK